MKEKENGPFSDRGRDTDSDEGASDAASKSKSKSKSSFTEYVARTQDEAIRSAFAGAKGGETRARLSFHASAEELREHDEDAGEKKFSRGGKDSELDKDLLSLFAPVSKKKGGNKKK